MARSLRLAEEFRHALPKFGSDSVVSAVVDWLIDEVVADPTIGDLIKPQVFARRARSAVGCPPLRIVYGYNETTIFMVRIEIWDELAAWDAGTGARSSDC